MKASHLAALEGRSCRSNRLVTLMPKCRRSMIGKEEGREAEGEREATAGKESGGGSGYLSNLGKKSPDTPQLWRVGGGRDDSWTERAGG